MNYVIRKRCSQRDTSMLVPQYGRMFANNDYLVEVGV